MPAEDDSAELHGRRPEMNNTGDDLPGEIRFVRDYLTRTFAHLIDMGDVGRDSRSPRSPRFLARALAAQAVRIATGCGPQEAAASVTDGPGDQGIDAIAISPNGSDIWFVQAKWSDQGKAVLSEEGALKLVAGLRHLAGRRYEGLNNRISRLLPRIDEALSSPECTVHLVAALAGDGHLAHQAEQRLAHVGEEFGFEGRTPVTVHTLGLADFHSSARLHADPVHVDITATFTQGWHAVHMPYPAYVGSVPAGEVAAWLETYRSRLLTPALRSTPTDRIDPAAQSRISEPVGV